MKLLNHQKDLFFTTFELISQAEVLVQLRQTTVAFQGCVLRLQ